MFENRTEAKVKHKTRLIVRFADYESLRLLELGDTAIAKISFEVIGVKLEMDDGNEYKIITLKLLSLERQ